MTKVFISYAHFSPEPKREQIISDLVAALRENSLIVTVDTDVKTPQGPEEGWPRWMKRQIKDADWVLMFFDELYRRRFDGDEVPGKGLGATWEGAIITHHYYRNFTRNEKFIPLLADGASTDLISDELSGATYYFIPMQTVKLANALRQPLPDSAGENGKIMPTESKATLHTTILACIARWRWLLGLEGHIAGEERAEQVKTAWLALYRLHAAWCEYSNCSPTEFDGLEQDIEFLTKRVGVPSSSYHQAVGEAVGQLLKSLERKIRPVPWRLSGGLKSSSRPEGWDDGIQEDDCNWWPFFDPHNTDVKLADVFRKVRLGEKDADGRSVASHRLSSAHSYVTHEWLKAVGAFDSDRELPYRPDKMAMNHPFGHPRQPTVSLNLASGEVANSLKVVEDVCVALRDLQWQLRFRLGQVAKFEPLSPVWKLSQYAEVQRTSVADIVGFIAEYQFEWSRHREAFRFATKPLLAEFAAVRNQSVQVGGGLFSCAAEALDTILLEVVCAPTGAPSGWSIPKLMLDVAPVLWHGYQFDIGFQFSKFLSEYYNSDDIVRAKASDTDSDLEDYVRRNASRPVETPEELWVRIASAPTANMHLEGFFLCQRYCNILKKAKLRLCDLDIDLLEAESKVEHAKVAAARKSTLVPSRAEDVDSSQIK